MKPCQGLEFPRLTACVVLGQVHMKDVDEGYMPTKTGQEETWYDRQAERLNKRVAHMMGVLWLTACMLLGQVHEGH